MIMFHVYSAGLVTDFPVKETSNMRGFANENFPAVRLSTLSRRRYLRPAISLNFLICNLFLYLAVAVYCLNFSQNLISNHLG